MLFKYVYCILLYKKSSLNQISLTLLNAQVCNVLKYLVTRELKFMISENYFEITLGNRYVNTK